MTMPTPVAARIHNDDDSNSFFLLNLKHCKYLMVEFT
jgi:hypothetical protein